jgi:hypothetical protein
MKFFVKAPNETLLGEATLNPQDGLETFGCFRRTSSGGKMLPPEGATVGLRAVKQIATVPTVSVTCTPDGNGRVLLSTSHEQLNFCVNSTGCGQPVPIPTRVSSAKEPATRHPRTPTGTLIHRERNTMQPRGKAEKRSLHSFHGIFSDAPSQFIADSSSSAQMELVVGHRSRYGPRSPRPNATENA